MCSGRKFCSEFLLLLTYYLPKARTNHGKFNIRFQGPMIWNSIDEDFKSQASLSSFKLNLQEHLTNNY